MISSFPKSFVLDEDDFASDSAVFPPSQQSVKAYLASLKKGVQWGLVTSNGTDADHDIDIAAGVAVADDQSAFIVLDSAITKQIDAAWAVGDDQGGLDTGTVASNTWYHLWLIRRSDTGVVDALFSTSASSPTMPTDYDQKCLIGSVLTDGSANILPHYQWGDYFQLKDPIADYSNQSEDGTADTRTISSPLGLSCLAEIYVSAFRAGGAQANVLVSSLAVNDTAVGSFGPCSIGAASGGASQQATSGKSWVLTNTSSQVRTRMDGGSRTFYLWTAGWIHPRGKW